jgi:Domain of unknown function (DUF5666)
MIGVTTRRASAARRSWRRWTPALAGLGVVLAATACGGSGGTATSTPPAASSSPGPTPTSTQAAFPGVIGTAAAVSGSSLEVQNPTSGQVTVTFTSATPITDTVSVTSKDLTVGSCVTVVGQPSTGGSASRTVTATSVTISTPVKGSCTGAGGFGFGSGGGFPRGTFSPNPSFSPRPRPTGSRGAFGGFGGFGGANGKVTSLSGTGFVVQGRNTAAGTDASTTVTTTATTKYLKVVIVHPSALKVGQCITAIGTPNSIGAVAARSIRISQPGPNGCVTGFGRRGGFGTATGGPTANA